MEKFRRCLPIKYLLGISFFVSLLIILPHPIIERVSASGPAPFEVSTVGKSSPVSENNCDNDLLCMEIVRESILKCWVMTMNGLLDTEHGFTVIKRGNDYNIAFSRNDNYFRKVSVIVPKGSIAIFHVHPNKVPPQPSRIDMEQAQKINIPICTITDRGIYCYFPDSQKTVHLRDFSELKKSCNNQVSYSHSSYRLMK
jgi:hypothetical protein